MESRVLLDLERAEMVLDLHSEGSAGGVCIVALSVSWRYSPRVRALSASPELELAWFIPSCWGEMKVSGTFFELIQIKTRVLELDISVEIW